MIPDLFDRHRSLRVLVVLCAAVLGLFLLGMSWVLISFMGSILLLFFLAWIVAFILEPVSVILQRHGMPRALAVSLIYVALLVVVSGGIVLAVPSIAGEVRALAAEITVAFSSSNLAALSGNAITTLRRLGLSRLDAQNVVKSFSSQIPGWTSNVTNNAVNSTTTLLTSTFNALFDGFLVLILSFYMMLDGDHLVEHFVLKLPPRWLPDVRLFQQYVEQMFGGFFRAQLTVGAIYGMLTFVVLVGLGQDSAPLVALLCGVLMMLPFIGTFLALVPPILLVLLQAQPDEVVAKLVILVVALIIAQNIVLQVLAPRIFGAQLGIHPLLLFAALLVGAKVGDVWGAFFAGPIFAVGFAMARVYYERVAKSSPLFRPVLVTEHVEAAPATPARPVLDPAPLDGRGSLLATLRSRTRRGERQFVERQGDTSGTAQLSEHPRVAYEGTDTHRQPPATLPSTLSAPVE